MPDYWVVDHEAPTIERLHHADRDAGFQTDRAAFKLVSGEFRISDAKRFVTHAGA